MRAAGAGVESVDVTAEGGEDARTGGVGIEGQARTRWPVDLESKVQSGLAGGGVEGDDVCRRGDAVEDAVDDDGLGLEVAASAGVIGPGDLEAGDVGAVDLLEGRVAGAFGIAAVGGPFLSRQGGSGEKGEGEKSGSHRLN